MKKRADDPFRVRARAPRERGHSSPFIKQVLKVSAKAGARLTGKPCGSGGLRRPSRRPGARIGRGHVAARFAGQHTNRHTRRVIVKARLVVLKRAAAGSSATHLRYIQREGVSRSGERGQLYGPEGDQIDAKVFEERLKGDRHQFRFIVSPEDAIELGELKDFTRILMKQVERDLGTKLEWVAVDHWDTDNPHTHILLRGRDQSGEDLVIAGDYIAQGMRARAAEIATEWLGLRTEREIQQSQAREVGQDRWTYLDQAIHQR